MSNKNSFTRKVSLIIKINKPKLKTIYGKLLNDNVEDFNRRLRSLIRLSWKMKKDLMIFK